MTARRTLFELKMRLLKPGSADFARELAVNERLSSDELLELAGRRRRELVRYAFTEIPFYREKYSAAGVELGDLENEDAFTRLPILEREEIRRAAGRMIAPGCRVEDLVESTTGGTTGEPLRTYHDPIPPRSVAAWRMLRWWGVDASDNSGYLHRAVPHGWRRAAQRVILWPTRRSWLSTAELSRDALGRFLRGIRRHRAAYLIGPVGAIRVFADYLSDRHQRIDFLRVVWTSGGPLTAGERRFFERVFRCPVYSQYGSGEFFLIAAECHHRDGLHMASDVRHVEVVAGDAPVPEGEWGDLVVTDLLERKFPLIRYRVGDRGRLLGRRCPCPLPFPLMDYVKGRIVDVIVTASGKRMPGEFWTTIFDDHVDEVRSFQVHQARDLKVTVRYEPSPGIDCSEVVAAVRASLVRQLGPGTPLAFEEGKVEVSDRGKPRFVVSEVEG